MGPGPVGTPSLFVGWSCVSPPSGLPAPGTLSVGSVWDLRPLPEGLRCKLRVGSASADALRGACVDLRAVVDKVEQCFLPHQVRERVWGLRLSLPGVPPSHDELQRACRVAAPLIVPLLPSHESSRLAVAVKGGELRVGWSGRVAGDEFEAVVPLAAWVLYLCLRDLRWATLPSDVPSWADPVRPLGGGFAITSIQTRAPSARSLWDHFLVELRRRVPEEALGRAGVALGFGVAGSPLQRLRAFFFGAPGAAGSEEGVFDDGFDFVGWLDQHAIFGLFSRSQLTGLVDEGRHSSYRQGSLLARQGQVGDSLFVLARGRVGVSVTTPAGELHVAVLEPGCIVGELSVLGGGPQQATCRALEYVEVLEILRSDLQALLRADADLAARVRAALAWHAAALSGDDPGPPPQPLPATAELTLANTMDDLLQVGSVDDVDDSREGGGGEDSAVRDRSTVPGRA